MTVLNCVQCLTTSFLQRVNRLQLVYVYLKSIVYYVLVFSNLCRV